MKRRFRLDVKTVVAVAIVLVLLGTYWFAIDVANRFYGFRTQTASTASQSEVGLRVLFRYLDELGHDARTLNDFDELPETGTIVVAAESALEKPVSDEEAARLRSWVESGGRLVLVGWQAREALLVSVREVAPSASVDETLAPVFPVAEVAGVGRIAVGRSRLEADDPAWVTVVGGEREQVLLTRTLGKGQVLWLSDVTPLSNAGIERADNAGFAVALVTTGGGPVYFDEYHHGFAYGGGVWERLGAGGQAALLIAFVAVALLVLALARRIGPPILESETPVVRTAAYIDSLAELYRKAGARGEALQVLEEGLARAVVRRYGTLVLANARRADVATVLEHSAALRARGGISESEFVSVAGRIVRLRREVEGIDG
ncbi:MAG: DUF4350 domain-containing protein [Coriobacteriia bacterium]|nr:DUF4350 domain-containing protein [Coriobacteriia bacterium]